MAMLHVMSVFAVLIQIEGLVGDIRQATYTGMPATLARSFPPAKSARPSTQPQSRTTVVMGPRPPTATTSTTHTGNKPSVKQMLDQRRQTSPSGK